MKNFLEIKQEFVEKNYSKTKLAKKIVAFKLAQVLLSEASITLMTAIPFLIGLSFYGFKPEIAVIYLVAHFLFYVLYIKKEYKKDILPAYDEIKMTIRALREIKAEK